MPSAPPVPAPPRAARAAVGTWFFVNAVLYTNVLPRLPEIKDALDLDLRFSRGEEVRTEVSSKFRRETVEAELVAAGLRLTDWWTDPADDFGVSLSRPAA